LPDEGMVGVALARRCPGDKASWERLFPAGERWQWFYLFSATSNLKD
jgi:hypothetical protein